MTFYKNGIKLRSKVIIYKVHNICQSVGSGRKLRAVRSFGVCLLLGTQAVAQTWDGSSGTNWGTAANWTPSGVPAYGATVNFDNTPGSNQTINIANNRQIAEANVGSSLDYTFDNGALVFVTGSRSLNYTGTGNLTINSKIIGSGGEVLLNNNSTGVMTINGKFQSWSSTSAHFTGSGTTVMNDTIGGGIPLKISGTGNRTFNQSINNAGLIIEDGTNTFNDTIGGGNITISGGDNDFLDDIGSATLNISGGDNFFDGSFGGGTTFNMTGGDATVTNGFAGGANISVNVSTGGLSVEGSIGGGANIDVASGQLALSGSVSGGASVSVQSGGTLLLEDGADLSAGGSNVELNSGTLAVTADNVDINSLTLNGSSTIDLLNDDDADINFGSVDGSGTMNIVNYNSTDQVFFDPGSSSINVSTQVFFEGTPGIIDPNDPTRIIPGVTPVPEPSTYIAGGLMALLLGIHTLKRRRKIGAKTG